MEQAVREEFEAWWNLPAQSELRKSCARGWAEVIWKASRTALRVELPKPEGGFFDVQKYVLNRCEQALQQAGIEVKP
ncbi:hypothetical protein ACM795_29690 [Pseudomonas aeruginosa]|uniref:hypothetical protein n=2 Tax=Pseudomonas aeruginosa TaxID=287 RepID=UPI002A6A1022|nr:hypothetical protein [Pseudomonas aeruginosa]MDY1143039.1 hypothetical protein [Pseudomonas aeruginosa]MDY1207966.1 hypothetical protein [Pseudomonas aeruginosa]